MKKSVFFTISGFATLMLILSVGEINAQETNSNSLIPADVKALVDKSCISCHSSDGSGMAASRVNFTTWEKYTPEKQASKADDICAIITKGKMPPKKFISSHPDAVLSDADKKIICDWAQSLQKTVN
jgi:hypothetical protein